jgi:predicted TIM-barrel fold metal-dependent hydrolase
MKIIDANSKPPCEAMLGLRFYSGGVAFGSRHKRGLPLDPALEKRSMELFVEQQAAVGIVHTVVHARAKGPGSSPQNSHEEIPNEAVAQLCAQYPGFSGVGSVDPIADAMAAEKAARLLKSGFKGIQLLPGWMPEATKADDRRHFPVYEVCVEHDRPVFLVNGGNAGPDMSWSDPIATDRVAAAFPRLKIVICYAGWPFVLQALGVVYRRPNVWLMPDSYLPGMPGEQDYLSALRTYARERFLFSVYYPMNPQRAHLDRIMALDIEPSALERYLYANAAELLALQL